MIRFVKPTIDNLHYKTELLSDKDTMSYNHSYGGTIVFSKDKYESWFNKWMNDCTRFYRLIFIDDVFIGETSYHKEDDYYLVDIIIKAKYRNKGYGTQVLKMLIEEAQKNGIYTLYDKITNDNPSLNMFLKNGFSIVDMNDEYTLVCYQNK